MLVIASKTKHQEKEKIKCDNCEKTFDFLSEMKKHKKFVHDKVKEFKCQVCEKCFATRPKLIRHSQAHSLKYYKCDKCDMKSSWEEAIKNHYAKTHGKILMNIHALLE